MAIKYMSAVNLPTYRTNKNFTRLPAKITYVILKKLSGTATSDMTFYLIGAF